MASKADIWMPLYIGDYLADTADLSAEQHGAYLLLLMHQWRSGPFPEDIDALRRVCRMGASSTAQALLKHLLTRFFTLEDDGLIKTWRQNRLEKERLKWNEKKRVYVDRASKGGRARTASRTSSSSASSTPQAVLGECTSPLPSKPRPPASQRPLSPLEEIIKKNTHSRYEVSDVKRGAGRSARNASTTAIATV